MLFISSCGGVGFNNNSANVNKNLSTIYNSDPTGILTSFSFSPADNLTISYPGTFNGNNITVTIPDDNEFAESIALVANFTTRNATDRLEYNRSPQTSGNPRFTHVFYLNTPVTYVAWENQNAETYSVTITRAPKNGFKSFSLVGTDGKTYTGSIVNRTSTITVNTPTSAIGNMQVLFTTQNDTDTVTINGATQKSGDSYTFVANESVAYSVCNVSAECVNYALMVAPSSSSDAIESFALALDDKHVYPATILNNVMTVTVPFESARVMQLFSLSAGINLEYNRIPQKSGDYNTFMVGESYQFIAWNGSEKFTQYTLNLVPDQKSFWTFTLADKNGINYSGVIGNDGTILVNVPDATEFNSMIATFTTNGANSVTVDNTQQISGKTSHVFEINKHIVYRVSASNGDYTDYTVTVTRS